MTKTLQWASPRRMIALAVTAAAVMAVLAVGANARHQLGVVVAPEAGAATVDYFLKLEGVDGESTDDRHKGEIEVESFSWGQNKPGLEQLGAGGSGGGAGAGKVSVHDLSLTMKSSKASPQLMMAVASGKHLKEAVLTVRKAGKDQAEFFKITLSDVLVSSYQVAGGGSSSLPSDQISLNFAKIKMQYFPQKADGSLGAPVEGVFDIKGNSIN